MHTNAILFLLAVSVFASTAPPSWMTQGPVLTQPTASFEIPIETIATKLTVDVALGGKPRRFVVDTGSPSMIDTTLAKELGLKGVGYSTGTDAHGAVIKSEIVQANIHIQNVIFKNVPMISADFSVSQSTKTIIGDGVLGSELLTLGAWQFDLKNSVLRFNTNVNKLPHLRKAKKLKLYQFGYPYMPIFDVQFAKHARSKAMLDTGSPTFFAISAADFSGARDAGGIGKTIAGVGSPGTSLGGQAPAAQQLQAELKTLSIGKIPFGRVSAERRNLSPSLIGARMLDHIIVTLDARTGEAYFTPYAAGPFAQPTFGFTLAFDHCIAIATVWEHSPAEAAGLRAGIELVSINGIKTELTDEGIRRAIAALEGSEIILAWRDGSAKITRKTHILLE